jgi:hypothetical protein
LWKSAACADIHRTGEHVRACRGRAAGPRRAPGRLRTAVRAASPAPRCGRRSRGRAIRNANVVSQHPNFGRPPSTAGGMIPAASRTIPRAIPS